MVSLDLLVGIFIGFAIGWPAMLGYVVLLLRRYRGVSLLVGDRGRS